MRRFTRRRKTLAAISAIMGRLGKSLQNTTRPIFKVHYRKLNDECNQQQEQLRFMPALPEYMSYCCCQCGHTQKLKVSSCFLKFSSAQFSRFPIEKIVVSEARYWASSVHKVVENAIDHSEAHKARWETFKYQVEFAKLLSAPYLWLLYSHRQPLL